MVEQIEYWSRSDGPRSSVATILMSCQKKRRMFDHVKMFERGEMASGLQNNGKEVRYLYGRVCLISTHRNISTVTLGLR